MTDETPQVTGESSPVSPEEFSALKDNLYGDDIAGGLQNIQVPPEELLVIKLQEEEVAKRIVMNGGDLPQKTDGVICVLTPEELMILKEVVENYSTNFQMINYCYDVMGETDPYKQQGLLRQLRDTIDMNLNDYVKLRPYSPFLSAWVKKVGKDDVRKLQD